MLGNQRQRLDLRSSSHFTVREMELFAYLPSPAFALVSFNFAVMTPLDFLFIRDISFRPNQHLGTALQMTESR